jgi:hypothetical protein
MGEVIEFRGKRLTGFVPKDLGKRPAPEHPGVALFGLWIARATVMVSLWWVRR